MPCRINVFLGRKRERSPSENPPKGDFVGFSHGDLSPRSPGENRTNGSRKRNAWNVAYFRVAGRKVAMRKHEKVIIWRFFAWRFFAFSPRKHDNTTWHKSATIFTSYYMYFSSLKICSQKNCLVSAILHHISLLRLLPNSYFKISTFQPNFQCSCSFKGYASSLS